MRKMDEKQKITDEDLVKMKPKELGNAIKRLQDDNVRHMVDHGNMMKEVNKRMQVHLMEIRGLKDINKRLQDDNKELRDLCCFLDDDRQKGRKLAREWQRFGRYTASVMRQEVSAYQSKLLDLESKQQELIKDNLELKELCLYLDEERMGNRREACNPGSNSFQSRRDDGDGSSSSTTNEEPLHSPHLQQSSSTIPLRPITQLRVPPDANLTRQRSLFNEQILRYVRGLEKRIQQLEEENKSLTQLVKKTERQIGEGSSSSYNVIESKNTSTYPFSSYDPNVQHLIADSPSSRYCDNKSGVIVNAMKVLHVHDTLEKSQEGPTITNALDNEEKAIVREMCNVVWKKLEDDPGCCGNSV